MYRASVPVSEQGAADVVEPDALAGLVQRLERVRMLLALELDHFAQPAAMTLRAAERGIDERPHEFLGGLRPDRARAKRQNVAAVVLDHLMGGVDVVGDARAHARELVGGDRDAGAAAADQDRALGPSRGDRLADQLGEDRVVVVRAVELGAEHDRFVAGVPDDLGDVLPDARPGVVGGNGDFQGSHSLPRTFMTRSATASGVIPSFW